MANTFLDTSGRTTGIATSNPQANVDQANNVQPSVTQNNNVNSITSVNQPQQSQTNQINPITIPIQIQPQVAQTAQNQTPSNVQPYSNLQVANNAQSNTAPTPQTYQGTNQSNNVVDFDQIYKSYNETVGNNINTNQDSSGVKKTSYNTTIVTPTASLNTVQGQYQTAYSDTINGLISEMLTKTQSGFQYDPVHDAALKMATEYAANSTLQSLAGSGVLNSSATSERVSRMVSELIPQYEEKAHDRWIEYLGQLADTAQLVMNYDSQQFEYWKDAKDREFKNKEFEYQKQQDNLENAWKRVDELGYVDNNASTILGVPVGTLSGAARLQKEQQEYELNRMREQAQIEHANDVALYKLKNELETQQSKELADYNHRLTQSNMEYEYTLANKYGKPSNKSSSNYSTYDEIIKNRFAEYDDFTKQYVVPDEQSYNELGNYLDYLNASGLITDEEFIQLSSKYSKYSGQNTTSNSNKDESITINGKTYTKNTITQADVNVILSDIINKFKR